MKPEIKEKWVAALRSGEYKQGRNNLANVKTNRFCCLGVLCEVALKEGVNLEVTKGSSMKFYNGECGYLPRKVAAWADCKDLPSVNTKDGIKSLAALNDKGVRFKTIAKLIEEQL